MSRAQKLLDICADENITVKKMTAEQLDAFVKSSVNGGIALKVRDEKFIVLDEAMQFYEKLLVLAHETAHHIFGHLDKDRVTEQMEDEARLFSVVYAALTIFNSSEDKKNA